jgi:cytoplasmic iron level regulating protein YaaA (DUF328/UPF0246 family)
MDMSPEACPDFSHPDFLDRSERLISKLRTFSKSELMDFMAVSEKLAELNRKRFADWQPPFTPDNAKQAILAFTGDVYDGLDAPSLTRADLNFTAKHLRILSGLYGLLRPFDLIQPYRLEMGRPLQIGDAKNLYEFWREAITDELNRLPGDLLINLASQEYFKAIDRKKLNKQILSPVFKDEKNGKLKIISFYAKKARGTMARFLIETRATRIGDLLTFSENGYTYAPNLSSQFAPVFTRSEQR